jgi:hypothetical protein
VAYESLQNSFFTDLKQADAVLEHASVLTRGVFEGVI